MDGVGLLPGQTAFDDGDAADWDPVDHPLQEMFAVPSDVAPISTYRPGEILVKLTTPSPTVPLVLAASSLEEYCEASTTILMGPQLPTESLQGLLYNYNVQSFEPVFPGEADGARSQADSTRATLAIDDVEALAADRSDLAHWYRVELPRGADINEAVAAFWTAPEVQYAEPNYEWGLTDEIPPVIEGLPDGTTDPYYDDQWFHTNAKIPNAWDYLNHNGVYPGGVHDIVTAVIDTGVDYTHEELVGNVWINIDEIPGNGIDDDGNGFVDDIHGCSVVSDGRSHSGDPVDLHGHGTHVAGIIAAQGFNGLGGVGVAFNTQIMAIRAAQYSGVLTTEDISEGILYAVDNGAEVINMSFGGSGFSQMVVDALEVALSQAVLVAAAGNSGGATSLYPAALPYVLGVGASTPKNTPAWFSNGADIYAPGVSIYSTLPGNNYASWSGTSMAAPIVSGVAGLMRSYFWQRDIYNSRFIMGCIAASGRVVDAYTALTEPPTPGVSMYENWLFDDTGIDPGNDDDGRIDSGETIHLAVELINRSGMAENVTATLVAQAGGAVYPDPYVTMITDTASFGNIGPFAMADNGLIWNQDGVITGVENPLVFTVSPDCPNDHVIPFVLTTTFEDGWADGGGMLTRVSRFNYIVQRGKNVPTVISEDTVLTSEDYWIVSGAVLVESGATLTIAEGTYVQFGAISDDPYNPGPHSGSILVRGSLRVEGTEERPVHLFPSYLVSGQTVKIIRDNGSVSLAYAKVRNPDISADSVDHVYFERDNYIPKVNATYLTNCIFHKFRHSIAEISANKSDTCLFDAGWTDPPTYSGNPRYPVYNTVYLQDNENNHFLGLEAPATSANYDVCIQDVLVSNGMSYAFLPMYYTSLSVAEAVANYYGGHVASILDAQEQGTVNSLISANRLNAVKEGYYIGLTDEGHPGTYTWLDGSPMTYTNWAAGQPADVANWRTHVVSTTGSQWTAEPQEMSTYTPKGTRNHWHAFILKLPGEWTKAELLAPYSTGELLEYVREKCEGTIRYNAFLSRYWDPNVGHWMHVNGQYDRADFFSAMHHNYWGTDTEALIDHAIVDYYDNFTRSRVEYKPAPEHGFESTYPFVESLAIDGMPVEAVPEIGAGPAVFEITFNRPMDPAIQPFVSFGPSSPHTDFQVHPVGGNDAGYNNNVAEFTVTLSLPCSQAVAVDYATVEGTAVGGVDYEITNGTVTFEPGEISQTIEVPLLGDIWDEPDKTFFLNLSEPTFVTLSDHQGQGTIRDDDPTLSIDDVEVLEGDPAAACAALFTVNLSAPLAETVTVDYETVSGSAVVPDHYEPTRGTLTFESGEVEQTVSVPIIGNDWHNRCERSFSVKLTHPTRVSIADNEGQCAILDDDPLISIADASVVEGDTGTADLLFTVSLSAPPTKTITVDYATADGTAVADEDYQATTGTLTFEAGEPAEKTIAVPVIGDTLEELGEVFLVNLSTVAGAVVADGQAEGMIIDNDGPWITIDDVTVGEGDDGELPWSSYLGGSSWESADDVAIDASGNIWVTGATQSADFPAQDGFDTSYDGGTDAYVAKFSPDGQLLWASYLGGGSSDRGQGVTVDNSGDAWVVGQTVSSGWVSGGFDTSYNGGLDDGFVAKISGDGQMLWSSYIGGQYSDYATGVAVDGSGNAWVTGMTNGGWASGGFDTSHNGGNDVFVAKINGDGVLLWSSYLGGSYDEDGTDIAIDASGDALVTGYTKSSNFPASGGFDTGLSGDYDAFVAKISSAGQLAWSSYLGGSSRDQGKGIAVDASGDAWLTGYTDSSGWASGGFDTSHNGGNDAFVTKIRSDGQQLLWSSYLGAGSNDSGKDITLDASGNVWLTGTTGSLDWISGGYGPSSGGGQDAFVAQISNDGQQLFWSNYLGGSDSEDGRAIAIDAAGNAQVAGNTDSSNWISGPSDNSYGGEVDGFLAKIGGGISTYVEFPVSLSRDPAVTTTVDYATGDGAATASDDYYGVSGRLTFEPGMPLVRSIRVPILGDQLDESDENFFVNLSNPINAYLTDDQGEGTIIDDDDEPQLSIDDVEIIEGDSGTTDAVFTVTLSVDPTETVTVDYATANGLALAGQDYQATSGTLTFEPGGSLTQTIAVPVIGDTDDESDEDFLVQLSNATGAQIADGEGAGTIQNDDLPEITIDDAAIWEGDDGTTELAFTIRLSADPLVPVTVDYDTADAAAVRYEDYEPAHGTVTWRPGEPLERTIGVSILGDAVDEGDETFVIDLSNVDKGVIGDAQAIGTISDDEPKVSIDDVKIVEGDAGSADAVFTVTLTSPPDRTVTVDYATADGTATVGEDYVATGGTLTFDPGQPTTQTIAVPAYGDTDHETNETFFVNLTGAAGAKITDAQGLGTIVGDDGPLVSIADATFAEGDSGTTNQAFTVSISADPPQRVVVDYETIPGTAEAGVDYASVSAMLVFDPGQPLQQNVLVPVIGDTLSESDETFLIRLTNATVVAISDDEALGTIADDDPLISIDDVTIVEGVTGAVDMVFTVGISMDPPDTVTLDYATAEVTATEGTDYLTASGTLTFTPGGADQQTITVTALGDIVNETHETFLVELSNLVNANFTRDSGIGTITDDDGPKLVIDDVTVDEGDSGTVDAVFTVSLTEATTQTITVDWSTADDSAVAVADYDEATGTLTFEPGEATSRQVTVAVHGDVVDELDETFLVELSNAGGAPILDELGVGTVTDDDAATLSINDVEVDEGFDGWINSRTWKGTYWVTPMTGESYHLMRISGAVAADDSWLVSGYDVGRFRFEVKTMGVAAMTLQATGQEGAIRLTWAQDDFDLLAGYHLYRSSSIDGTYERLNGSLIPVGSESFLDTDVTPAVPMYYKFTVVQTDMTESDFSNVAAAAAMDTFPPVITHVPVTSALPGFGLGIDVEATDNVSVVSVDLHYRPMGGSDAHTTLSMVNISGNAWTTTIPGSEVQTPGLEYYITASDGISTVYDGTPVAPHTVVVDDTPTLASVSPNQGPLEGGTTVTLSGTLFQDGASVLFGTMPASDVVVLSSNQITCTTPPHVPMMVDVTVINDPGGPGETTATLLNGYRFVDEDVVVSLPTVFGDQGAILDIPLSIANVDGLLAADVSFSFDPAVLSAQSARTGTLTSGWSIAADTGTPGTVVLSLASGMAVSGSGVLANISFEVVGTPTSQTDLTVDSALLNDGAVFSETSNGLFTVNGLFALSGTVDYFTDNAVPGVTMSLVGVGVHEQATDTSGDFSFSDIQTGAYVLTPDKNDDVDEITAYDASLVLQAAAGLLSLSSEEELAADVNRNNSVTSMDGSFILQKSVDLISTPFPGAGRVWDFVPDSRSYDLINDNLAGQDFTAILIGDVSGNWQAPPPEPPNVAGTFGSVEHLLSNTVVLTLPEVEGSAGQQVQMPLQIDLDGESIYSANLVLTYDSAELSVEEVVPGSPIDGMSFVANSNEPGVIQIGVAGAQPLTENGVLLEVSFTVVGTLENPSPVFLESVDLDEGVVPVAVQHGAVSDTLAPIVVAVENNDGELRPNQLTSLTFTLSEDVGASIEVTDLAIHNDSTGQDVDLSSLTAEHLSYDPVSHVARWDLSSVPLPAAYYTYTLNAASITDLAGNPLDGNGNGVGGDDHTGTLMVAVNGDVNLDGSVNLADLVTMGHPNHWGQSGLTWLEGDLNFDSNVNMVDLIILGDPSNWDKSLGMAGVPGAPPSGQVVYEPLQPPTHDEQTKYGPKLPRFAGMLGVPRVTTDSALDEVAVGASKSYARKVSIAGSDLRYTLADAAMIALTSENDSDRTESRSSNTELNPGMLDLLAEEQAGRR